MKGIHKITEVLLRLKICKMHTFHKNYRNLRRHMVGICMYVIMKLLGE
jgi:hypothetical protein